MKIDLLGYIECSNPTIQSNGNHGGELAVVTRPGAGATFIVRLSMDGKVDAYRKED